jgi:hypothetical protein
MSSLGLLHKPDTFFELSLSPSHLSYFKKKNLFSRWCPTRQCPSSRNSSDPIAFIPIAASTSARLYPDFIRLLFLHAHREASALANEVPKSQITLGSNTQLALLTLRGFGLRVSIPIDLSSRPFIRPPRFLRSHCSTPLLQDPSLVLPLPLPRSA